jgi:hypothetical protein
MRIETRLREAIGRFLFQSSMSSGDARLVWNRYDAVLKRAERLVNNPRAKKKELVRELTNLIGVAYAAITPRWKIDTLERIEHAKKILEEARGYKWLSLFTR